MDASITRKKEVMRYVYQLIHPNGSVEFQGTAREIADKYGVTVSNVSDCARKKYKLYTEHRAYSVVCLTDTSGRKVRVKNDNSDYVTLQRLRKEWTEVCRFYDAPWAVREMPNMDKKAQRKKYQQEHEQNVKILRSALLLDRG